jgi:hypothetical protein
MYDRNDLKWHGANLRSRSGRLLATIVPEPDSALYRVRLSDGRLTDMVNLTRARDAACCLALADLNREAQTRRLAA